MRPGATHRSRRAPWRGDPRRHVSGRGADDEACAGLLERLARREGERERVVARGAVAVDQRQDPRAADVGLWPVRGVAAARHRLVRGRQNLDGRVDVVRGAREDDDPVRERRRSRGLRRARDPDLERPRVGRIDGDSGGRVRWHVDADPRDARDDGRVAVARGRHGRGRRLETRHRLQCSERILGGTAVVSPGGRGQGEQGDEEEAQDERAILLGPRTADRQRGVHVHLLRRLQPTLPGHRARVRDASVTKDARRRRSYRLATSAASGSFGRCLASPKWA